MSSSLDHIGEEIAEEVTHHDAALHHILTKLRIFDAGGGYVSQGFRTCAHWLSWRVNWTLTTAREHVRVAEALGNLPLIDGAFERGVLSYCKVRALTRVASAANEATLLELAFQMTGNDLEKACRKFAAVKRHDDPPATPDDDNDRRYVRRREREDGMVVIEAVLHPDEADIVSAAIERIAKERCRARADVAAADGRSATGGSHADTATASAAVTTSVVAPALTSVDAPATTSVDAPATTSVDAPALTSVDAPATTSVDAPNASAEASRPAPTARSRTWATSFDRASALVEIAEQVLRGTSPDRSPVDIMITIPIDTLMNASSTSRTPDASASGLPDVGVSDSGTFVSAVTARRLACDAGLIALVEDANQNALSVGRKRRTIPAGMKRAMICRDQTCRYPGCNARVFLEGHHLEHWVDGGETEINNVISLCGYHHRFVHEYGFKLAFDPETNTVSVHDPARQRWMPAVAPPNQPSDLGWPTILRRNEGRSITAETQPTWDATPVDWGEIVDGMLRSEAGAASAEDEPDTN